MQVIKIETIFWIKLFFDLSYGKCRSEKSLFMGLNQMHFLNKTTPHIQMNVFKRNSRITTNRKMEISIKVENFYVPLYIRLPASTFQHHYPIIFTSLTFAIQNKK